MDTEKPVRFWMVVDLSQPPSATGGPQYGPFATLAEAEEFAEGHESYAVLPV